MSIGNLKFDDGIKSINSNLVKPLDTLITEKTTETKSAITTSQNTVTSAITAKEIIKSIQMGDQKRAASEVNVTVSTVNMSKCLVLVTGNYSLYSNTASSYNGIGWLTSPTNLFLKGGSSSGSVEVHWQIIEFY